MAKNAVMTIAMGNFYQKMAEMSHPTLKAYADKIGADFIVIDQQKISQTSPHWEKFQIYDYLLKYERILFLDTDIIVREDCPNLFEIVPRDQLGMFNEGPWTEQRIAAFHKGVEEYDLAPVHWDGEYYNTGVMVISRVHRNLFKKPEKEIFNFYEQTYINIKAHKEKTSFFSLEHYFNRMECMDKYTGEDRRASYIIHYAGTPDQNVLLEIMKRDLQNWKEHAPEYKYQRHVLIDVQGGLGDQIDAEPTIRYLLKNVYPGEDVRIVSHFPRVFQHLASQVPVAMHGEMTNDLDGGFYHINTLPGPTTMMWHYVSNLLCHTVDFCAMACLRRTLPDVDKQIQMEVNFEEISSLMDTLKTMNLKDLVLVHPGRHWDSKTFPTEWWQRVIDQLHAAGEKVCIIGKDDDTRGTVDVVAREGMIDTRDLLEIGEFIALISEAKITISNDSSPVHIAGAFDNWVILIPTCKHPDHILPWRNGSKTYKTKALYKKLVIDEIDSAPTQVYGQTAEFLPGDIYEYLPDPEDIIKAVIEINEGILGV